MDEKTSRNYFRQLITAVDYCHDKGISHRDIKPENILIESNGVLKIADFGLSNIIKDGKFLMTSCGSPNYAPPEIIKNKGYDGKQVDIWSCGIVLYVALTGTLPFDCETMPLLY